MGGEHHRVFGVFDDVDLLPAQLADDGLHAHALHADARADAIHVAVAALYRDLGSLAGFARAALDGHCAIVDFRDFLLEQAHHQLGRGARHQHARAFAGLIDQPDHAAHAVAHRVTFQARLLLLGQLGFGLAEIENVLGAFHALDRAVDQLAGAPGVLVVDGFALGLAHLLQDDLLGGLGGDPAQLVGVLRDADFRARFGIRLDSARLGQRHFVDGIFHHLDRFLHGEQVDGAGLRIHLRHVVFVGAVVFAGGDQHGVLHCVEDDLRIDALFLA